MRSAVLSILALARRCAPHWPRLPCVLALAVMGLAGLRTPAAAQMGSNTIVNEQGTVLFQVPETGGLLAPGTFGTGEMPVEGAGTRLVWHPGKAAFRAGRVGFGLSEGTEWSDANVGAYSAAFGVDTQAGGRGAAAMGQGTTANGNQSLAGGYRTTASGLRSTAFGDLTKASGNFSTALGIHTTAQATTSLAIGRWNVVGGTATSWRNSDPLLAAGNGSGPSDRSNALLLRKNGDLTISGSLTEHSDRRLKTDVETLGPVSNPLNALRPVRFHYKENTGHPTGEQLGLIAQDVQKVFPNLVRKGRDGFLSLAYPKLAAVLVKGLQEQRARIDALEKKADRLDRMEQRQETLASELDKLKRGNEATAGIWRGFDVGLTGLLLLLIGGVLGVGAGRHWD